jgi:hypothetical protein
MNRNTQVKHQKKNKTAVHGTLDFTGNFIKR